MNEMLVNIRGIASARINISYSALVPKKLASIISRITPKNWDETVKIAITMEACLIFCLERKLAIDS